MTDLTHPKSVTLDVTINLDPIPGAFHTPADVQQRIERILVEMIPHYKPTVSIRYPRQS